MLMRLQDGPIVSSGSRSHVPGLGSQVVVIHHFFRLLISFSIMVRIIVVESFIKS